MKYLYVEIEIHSFKNHELCAKVWKELSNNKQAMLSLFNERIDEFLTYDRVVFVLSKNLCTNRDNAISYTEQSDVKYICGML